MWKAVQDIPIRRKQLETRLWKRENGKAQMPKPTGRSAAGGVDLLGGCNLWPGVWDQAIETFRHRRDLPEMGKSVSSLYPMQIQVFLSVSGATQDGRLPERQSMKAVSVKKCLVLKETHDWRNEDGASGDGPVSG